MSSNPPEGTFFVDQGQPPAAPLQPAPASLQPPAEPAPAAPPTPAPVASTPPPAPPADAPTRNVPLGTLIFRAGLLAEEQLEDALQEGMRTGKRLGEVLVERGWLNERDLGRLLAAQKGLSFVELNGTVPDPAALQMIPEEKARLHATLPLRFEAESLVVAIDDPTNGLVLENLRRTLGYDPQLVVAAHGDLLGAIDQAYSALTTPAPAVAEPLAQEPEPPATPPAAPPAAPTPMPTVLPPAEGRSEEVQPLVSAPDAHIPLAGPEPVQQAEQPAPEQPAPVASPPPAPVEAAPPAPVLESPAVQSPAPVQAPEPPPSAPVAPPQPEPVAAEPVAAEPIAAEPVVAPAVEPVAAQPVVTTAVEPVAAVAQETVQPSPALEPEGPAVPAAPVANGTQPDPAAVTLHFVVLRLGDGEQMEIGSFGTPDEARTHAQQVIGQIAAAEGQASWPFFAGRFLRPDTIVSVDLVTEPSDKWMGSAARTRWGNAS